MSSEMVTGNERVHNSSLAFIGGANPNVVNQCHTYYCGVMSPDSHVARYAAGRGSDQGRGI